MVTATRPALASDVIGNLVRRDLRVVAVLADAGVSPRYLHWTLEAAASDLGVSLEALLQRLERILSAAHSAAA